MKGRPDPSYPPLSSNSLSAHREHDRESGLVHMRARMYEPRVGRFTQVDPVGNNRPLDHCLYADNIPANSADPMGLQAGPILPPGKDWNWWRKHVLHEDEKVPINPRVKGAARATLGTLGMAASAAALGAPEPTLSKVAGWAGMVVSAAEAYAGFKQIITGKSEESPVRTAVREVAERTGATEGQAELVADVVEAASAGAAAGAATAKATAKFSKPLLRGHSNLAENSIGRGGITFRTSHAVPHLRGTGVAAETVEAAITRHIQQATRGASATGEFWGRVTVKGRIFEYRAYTLPDKTITVGTYYVPR